MLTAGLTFMVFRRGSSALDMTLLRTDWGIQGDSHVNGLPRMSFLSRSLSKSIMISILFMTILCSYLGSKWSLSNSSLCILLPAKVS